jgi:prepilin signal peptidase PulO-like enzyme (type II secretory pathway)
MTLHAIASAGTAQPAGTAPPQPARRSVLPGPRQLVVVVLMAVVAALALIPWTHNTYVELLGETLFVGIMLLLAFTSAGAWRQTAIPRWVAQVVAVLLAAMLTPLLVQLLGMGGDVSAFMRSPPHLRGYILVTAGAALIGALFALGTLYRERDAQARAQVLQFELERETLERRAADARLHLMTAQIQPHFLLNTLANVQELLESGSPRAVPVFRSLIAYLRAAVPRLQHEDATLEDEERLVRAYLELMHMRMPDRLVFSIDVEPALRAMRFPPMSLLTLVENAIRHGIDPCCDECRIDIGARRVDSQKVQLWVADTGLGMAENAGEGTGLANLRARLKASFGDGARLEYSEQPPHGLRADVYVTA